MLAQIYIIVKRLEAEIATYNVEVLCISLLYYPELAELLLVPVEVPIVICVAGHEAVLIYIIKYLNPLNAIDGKVEAHHLKVLFLLVVQIEFR